MVLLTWRENLIATKSMLPVSHNLQKPELVPNYPSVSTEKEMFLTKYAHQSKNKKVAS